MASLMRTRSALTEIPLQLDQLRVTSEDTFINETILDNAINNIPLSYLSPAPSPDELIIRQRGRRRISLTWSPDKTSMTSNSQRTPTKSTMILRSSPRKRTLLSEFSPSIRDRTHTPRKVIAPHISTRATPTQPKRLRFDERPVVQTYNTVSLNTLLKGYTKDQLISIINGLIQGQSDLDKAIRVALPIPDLKPMEDELNTAKKQIFKSLPTSRLVRKTDSNGYARASLHLAAFKKHVTDHGRQLHESKHWDALLDYTMMAWQYVKATPNWDNHIHNAMRRNCFKLLAWYSSTALRYGGTLLGAARLNEFIMRVHQMIIDCEEMIACQELADNLLVSAAHSLNN